jgi:3-methyladenine DNA glycosylase AlkC
MSFYDANMDLISASIEIQIQQQILGNFLRGEDQAAVDHIRPVLDGMYAGIPAKKRISHGRYTTIKVLSENLFAAFQAAHLPVLATGAAILELSADHRTTGVGLGVLALYGLEDYGSILPYFEAAAQAEHWEPREYAQGLFRKVIKTHRTAIRPHLLSYAQSHSPNLRRFVSETLRPVVENWWLYEDLDYSLSIIRHLFREPHPYPRTSVGNHLSDIARRDPERVYQLVAELVSMDNRHAYWIATRACRNLVKKDPMRVMDLLGVDTYKYKDRIYKRDDLLN